MLDIGPYLTGAVTARHPLACTDPSVHRPALNVATFIGTAMIRFPTVVACCVSTAAFTLALQAKPCVVGSFAVKLPVLLATTLPRVALPSARKTRAPGKPAQVLPFLYW